jgi:ribose transport system substrate-binding protein
MVGCANGKRTRIAVAVLALVGIVTAASPAFAVGSSGYLTAAEQSVTDSYSGTFTKPPTKSPKPAVGKDVWIISCGQSSAGCAAATAGLDEAAKAIGWKTNVVDGMFGAGDAFNNGIRQGIAAGSDAIMLVAIDCSLVRQALVEAKQAKVPVVSQQGVDCDNKADGNQKLFATPVRYATDHPDFVDFNRAIAAQKADWAASVTDGNAKIIELVLDGSVIGATAHEGFTKQIKKCKTCEVVDSVVVQVGEATNGVMRQKFEAALLQHPEATVVVSPLDSYILLGVGPAVIASGRQLKVMGNEGLRPNLGLIAAARGQDAAMAVPTEWNSYATVDALNRYFAGKPSVASGVGWQLVDKDHLPANATSGYAPPVDFRAAYKKAWGVG